MHTNRTTKIATQFRGLHGMSAVAEFPSKTKNKSNTTKAGAVPKLPGANKAKPS